MYKIVIMTLLALPLFAGFFPPTIHTSVSEVSHKSIGLSSPFPINGMSGIIVHDYNNGLNAITRRIIQTNNHQALLIAAYTIHHNKLPTIKTTVKKGDQVIGGYLYHNVLLLAPNAEIYRTITEKYNKNWIHPDLYALFLSKEGETIPTKKNLATFAKKYQVGLIYIVGHAGAKLLDPISGYIVGKQSIKNLPKKGESPFFMRLDRIESGLFSGIFSSKKPRSYYQIVESI